MAVYLAYASMKVKYGPKTIYKLKTIFNRFSFSKPRTDKRNISNHMENQADDNLDELVQQFNNKVCAMHACPCGNVSQCCPPPPIPPSQYTIVMVGRTLMVAVHHDQFSADAAFLKVSDFQMWEASTQVTIVDPNSGKSKVKHR